MQTQIKLPGVRNSILISLVIASLITIFFVIRGEITDMTFKWYDIGLSMSYSFLVSALLFILDGWSITWLSVKFPWNRKPLLRVLIEFLFCIINGAFVAVFVRLFIKTAFSINPQDIPDDSFIDQIGITVILNLFMILFFEGRYFFFQWRDSLIEAEISKRKHIESQYVALKNQVNPHFLFNSLNVLSALIDESSDKAKEFVDRFSRIYRCILESSEIGLALLSEEIKFLNDYFHLQKIRYGDKITLDINVPSISLEQYLPTLSLQLLVENAIKHNEVSSKNPLHIKVLEKDNYLVVKNKIQPRSSKEMSTGQGLKNLADRYSMLSELKPSFVIEKGYFIASIPLLNTIEE